MARLSELLAKQGAGCRARAICGWMRRLMPGAATVELIELIEAAGPFGQAPLPRALPFPTANHFAKQVGASHLKVSFGDGLGGAIDAICLWSL